MKLDTPTKLAAALALLAYVLGVLAVSIYVQHNDIPAPDLTTFKAHYIFTGFEVLGLFGLAGGLIYTCLLISKQSVCGAIGFGLAAALGLCVFYAAVLQGASFLDDLASPKSARAAVLVVLSGVGALLVWTVREVAGRRHVTWHKLPKLELKPLIIGFASLAALGAGFVFTDIYGIYVYPQISSQLGGGKPTHALMVFTEAGANDAQRLSIPVKANDPQISEPLTILLDGDSFYAVETLHNTVVQIAKSDVRGLQVDSRPPVALDVQSRGAKRGEPRVGDRVILTYSERMDPESLIPGWLGVGPFHAYIEITRQGSHSTLRFADPRGTRLIDFSSVRYAQVFGRGAYPVVVRRKQAKIVITLRKNAPPTSPLGSDEMTWSPSTKATDLAGNTCLTVGAACKGGTVVESTSGGADPDF